MTIGLSRTLRLALVSAPVLLAACSSTPMPTGYTYEHEIYRTPPGPEAHAPKDAKVLSTGQDAMAPVGSDTATVGSMPAGMHDVLTATATRDGSGNWDSAAEELVKKILHDLGKPMEKVDVPGNDDFVPSLKKALKNHDIPVMDRVGDGPFVIQHQISGDNVTIDFFSNHSSILTESGDTPMAAKP